MSVRPCSFIQQIHRSFIGYSTCIFIGVFHIFVRSFIFVSARISQQAGRQAVEQRDRQTDRRAYAPVRLSFRFVPQLQQNIVCPYCMQHSPAVIHCDLTEIFHSLHRLLQYRQLCPATTFADKTHSHRCVISGHSHQGESKILK